MKKSFPWFLILLLVFTMTAGFYFQKTKDDIVKFGNSNFANEPWFLFQSARADDVSTGATVANFVPVVSAVALNGGVNISITLNATKAVTAVGKITDNNGCSDISAVAARIYFNGAGSGDQCSASDNTCYVITGANCSSTCQGTTEAHVTCPASLWYHVEPTDDSGAQEWLGTIFATDSASATHKASNSSTVEVVGATGMTVLGASIAYGSVAVGSNTGTGTQPTLIMNIANTAIDALVSGTAMTSAASLGTIAVGKQKWHVGGFTYATGGTVLAVLNTQAEIICPKPISNTPSNSSDTIGWGLGIDIGTQSGTDYGGKTTITVTND